MGTFPLPATIEIKIRTDAGEVVLTRKQATDSVGRTTEPATATLNAAVQDARAWLRRNA